MKWTIEEMNNILKDINEKAQKDKEFRTLCLENPELAIKQVSERELPDGFKIRFVENEGVHLTHILPNHVGGLDELDEAALEHITGGEGDKPSESSCQYCGSNDIKDFGEFGYSCNKCGYGISNLS